MASPTTRHLLRLWRSVPLPKLKQGSTLTVTSSLTKPTHVLIQPEWRDSGLAELKQVFLKSDEKEPEVDMIVKHDKNIMTSLGREEPCVSLHLQTSSAESTVSPIPQGDTIHYSKSKSIDKVILDDGSIVPDSADFVESLEWTHRRRVDYHDGVAHITESDGGVGEVPGTYLKIQVPEKVNLDCDLENGGSISVSSKVEGDVRFSTSDGDISVSKLRGHSVDLHAGSLHNTVYAKNLLEAKILAVRTPGRVRAKQIHGDSIEIVVEPLSSSAAKHTAKSSSELIKDEDDEGSLVDISSLFVSGNGGATIDVGPCHPVRRAVRVKAHHGPLQVVTNGVAKPLQEDEMTGKVYPLIELGGVNGTCEVSMQRTVARDTESGWSSCLCHFDSLSHNSVSLITVDRGDTSITLDRKVEADLRLLSASSSECLEEAGALLAEKENSSLVVDVVRNLPTGPVTRQDRGVTIDTTAFTTREEGVVEEEHFMYVDGYVENRSEEPDSRLEQKLQNESSSVGGKVRLDSAADQALRSFSNDMEDSSTEMHDGHPLVAVASTGRIVVETLSWIGAIARRHGLEENERELGRTASRRGRPTGRRDE